MLGYRLHCKNHLSHFDLVPAAPGDDSPKAGDGLQGAPNSCQPSVSDVKHQPVQVEFCGFKNVQKNN